MDDGGVKDGRRNEVAPHRPISAVYWRSRDRQTIGANELTWGAARRPNSWQYGSRRQNKLTDHLRRPDSAHHHHQHGKRASSLLSRRVSTATAS
uniref:Uncharacterized protein n=1 Tax=Plectus sambesii TaxID=2011161 RepID=A0A914X322_9BILA